MLVVTMHATTVLGQPNILGERVFGGLFSFGHAGVDFFFVLSGFIITFIHARDIDKPAQFRAFWRKRLWRVFPLYWFATLSFQALLAFSPTAGREEQHLSHILASWLLFPEAAWPILDVGWSLRHEFLFYALFSVLILNRRMGSLCLAIWAGVCLLNASWIMATGEYAFSGVAQEIVFRPFNIEFFFGMSTALLVRRRVWRPACMLAAGVAIFFGNGLYESFGPKQSLEWPAHQLLYALGAALILYGVARLDLAQRWTIPAWALKLGTASYSIYLIHMPVVLVSGELIRRAQSVVSVPVEAGFVAVLVVSVIAGLVVHRYVERPIMRYSSRLNTPLPISESEVITRRQLS